MKKIFCTYFILVSPLFLFSQISPSGQGSTNPFEDTLKKEKKDVYEVKRFRYTDSMQVYKYFKLYGDTSYLDTSLSMKSYYELNMLGRDLFGLQQLSNIGQPFGILTYQKSNFSTAPKMGFYGRDFYYRKSEDVLYYDVKSPIAEIHYKNAFESGNVLNAMFTANINPNINFSFAYNGIRSVGDYVGTYYSQFNFIATLYYKSSRYNFFSHFINQNVSGDENGGIKDVEKFIDGSEDYSTKSNVPVNLSRNVNSLIKGQNYFFTHFFNIINDDNLSISIDHEFSYDDKYFSYKDPYDKNSQDYYGSDFVIKNYTTLDSVFYKNLNNDIGGKISIFKNDFKISLNFNKVDYYYRSVKFFNNTLIENLPSSQNQFLKFDFKNTFFKNITINAKYIQGLNGSYSSSNFISLNGVLNFNNFKIEGNYQIINKYPDFTYFVFQSNYQNFNWKNDISILENRNEMDLTLRYKEYSISSSFNSIKNYYYFGEDRMIHIYDKNINIFSAKISLPIRFWKFGLENDFIFQEALSGKGVYRIPQIITRNTLYFQTRLSFIGDKKVAFLQTGVTFNMFSSYMANSYNPLYSDYYLQNSQAVGNFPVIDLFLNVKVRTMRIFVIGQHFNNVLSSKNNYFSAPNQPYTDFIFRFGIIWNFFS